jgi:hypothetical protein
MKLICKNCRHCMPTYKGGACELKKGKKVKMSGSCENGRGKSDHGNRQRGQYRD